MNYHVVLTYLLYLTYAHVYMYIYIYALFYFLFVVDVMSYQILST